MADEKQLRRLLRSVKEWNAWRRRYPHIKPDLSGADLNEADLTMAMLSQVILSKAFLYGAKLWRANLSEALLSKAILIQANLREAKLWRANLSEAALWEAELIKADLSEADLSRAQFFGAYLIGTNLRAANLSEADLQGANLRSADLSDADLDRAIVGYTTFAAIDLTSAKGLDTVKHVAPSSIGIDTIYLSKGKIPESFLRGCGVPDDFIEYIQSLPWEGIQYYTCFIAHSSEDQEFCDRLYSDLEDTGVRCWYFPETAKWGETVWGEIDRAISVHDKLVVVCSENSLQSGPVLREIERALQREDKEKRNILFPIRIDDYIREWKHERKADVLAKVAGDFRGWSRSAAKYDKAFEKLLKHLKAS